MSVRLYDMMHFEIKTTESALKVLPVSQHLLIWLFADTGDQIGGVSPISPVGFFIASHVSLMISQMFPWVPRQVPLFRFQRIYLPNNMRLLAHPKPFNPLFRAFNCNKLSLLKKSFLLFLLSAHLKIDYFELVSNIALTSHKLSFLSSTSLIKNTTFDTVQMKFSGFTVQNSNVTV